MWVVLFPGPGPGLNEKERRCWTVTLHSPLASLPSCGCNVASHLELLCPDFTPWWATKAQAGTIPFPFNFREKKPRLKTLVVSVLIFIGKSAFIWCVTGMRLIMMLRLAKATKTTGDPWDWNRVGNTYCGWTWMGDVPHRPVWLNPCFPPSDCLGKFWIP